MLMILIALRVQKFVGTEMHRADFFKALVGLGLGVAIVPTIKEKVDWDNISNVDFAKLMGWPKEKEWSTVQDVHNTIDDYDYLSKRWPRLLTQHRNYE